ncbi:hypothetical protein FH972_000147 [Carpinus fangiana]|uniref:PGG domain-containing protein n=1 Tax=Carpinus fangiana TaxID=176857 RepID=A0A5N6Q7W3_9ROSI|nr:hypothetical protein FH972_000147 [Carpinus fangiana]
MASTVAEKADAAKDHELNGKLYKALLKEEADRVIQLCQGIEDHALHNLIVHNDTVLHKATYAKQGNLAATLDQENSVTVATKMFEKAPELLSETNNIGETALFRAARYGKTEIFHFLAERILGDDEAKQKPFIQRTDKTTILHIAILAQHFGLALKIVERFGHIIDERDEDGMTALRLLSCNPSAFQTVRRRGLLNRIINSGGSRRNTPLFLATKLGCIEIVTEILDKYPQAIEHIDNKGRTILHVAIKYRQLEVFELVLKMEVAMRWLIRRLDNNGNSILHMVGIKREDYVPEKLRGPAFELQEELLWFERVRSVTKAHFIDHQNNMNKTAQGLFASTYKDLRNEAREWLKKTAEGCTIVAVLISTVAFAAAYTIPGGPNQSTGVPVLLYQPFFVVFTAADVLSLASALTSVVIFLSILTAPYRLDDFRHSLPNKLMLGVTFLFLSVSMMMIAFAATIFLMIRGKESWIKIVLYSLSFLPAIRWSKWFRGLSHSSNRPLPQLTDSTKHKSEREDFYSLAAPHTSHLSV